MKNKDHSVMESVQDDIDQELLPLFIEEAHELYPQIADALQAWRAQAGDWQMQRKLQRCLHTFKGSARMAGAMRLGELAHRMEDRITDAQHPALFWDELQSDFEQIGSMVGQLQNGQGAMSTTDSRSMAEEEILRPVAEYLPFSHISRRLYRVARQTGKELGKKVNLELQGGELKIERSLLERMTAPFEHMLRNAIAHGLERAEERQARGKSPMGEIRLSLRHEADEVIFEISDDGAGLDVACLREKGVEQGLLQADEAVSEREIMPLIFVTGLSTANSITKISGRGVGMDVVRSEIAALGGNIEIFSERGKGTRFVIHIPNAAAQA